MLPWSASAAWNVSQMVPPPVPGLDYANGSYPNQTGDYEDYAKIAMDALMQDESRYLSTKIPNARKAVIKEGRKREKRDGRKITKETMKGAKAAETTWLQNQPYTYSLKPKKRQIRSQIERELGRGPNSVAGLVREYYSADSQMYYSADEGGEALRPNVTDMRS